MWLKPVVQRYPDSVPSALYLTDVFLYIDDLLEGNLLKQGPKVLQASDEAMRVKRLVGALRYLYRNSR